MGDEYIKKEDAVKAVANAYWHGTDCECYAFARKALDNVPTADVAPVRHGRWIEMSYDEYKCSACEKVVREEILYAIKPSDREDDPMHIANYCPCCGSKMDGGYDK